MTVERIRIPRAMEITGEPERTLQALAARGSIPGAAKLSKAWTFDERQLRGWVKDRERGQCRSEISTSVAGRGGSVSRLTVGRSEEAYEQAMSRLRNAGQSRSARAQ